MAKSWEAHACAYVLESTDPELSFEVAAALSQFEPVSVCVQGKERFLRAKRSLPDHIRVVQHLDPPNFWTERNPVSFVRGPSGDVRAVEYACASTDACSILTQIAESERMFRYSGPGFQRAARGLLSTPFLDVGGNGKIFFEDAIPARPDELRMFAKGMKDFILARSGRFVGPDVLLVPRGTPKVTVENLAKSIATVRVMDERYLGFYIANGGVLMPAYGKEEHDSRALKLLQELFPRRRIIRIETSRVPLNLNDLVLGIPGAQTRPLPGSMLAKARAMHANENGLKIGELRARLEEEQRRNEDLARELQKLKDESDAVIASAAANAAAAATASASSKNPNGETLGEQGDNDQEMQDISQKIEQSELQDSDADDNQDNQVFGQVFDTPPVIVDLDAPTGARNFQLPGPPPFQTRKHSFLGAITARAATLRRLGTKKQLQSESAD